MDTEVEESIRMATVVYRPDGTLMDAQVTILTIKDIQAAKMALLSLFKMLDNRFVAAVIQEASKHANQSRV